ncbi:MAG: PQQ-binding-like beta-propeller repeat protein [Caldisericia bacterium]|nr:PQQ-binding-like beta-propeller repeat protein [Caldisericia bacterium]
MKLSNKKLLLIILLIIFFVFPSREIVLTLSKTDWITPGGNQERTFYSPIEINPPLSKKWQLWNERVIDFVVSDEYMFIFFSSGVIRRFDVISGKFIDQRKPISGSFSIAMNHYPIIKEYELKEGINPLIVPKVRYTLYFIEYETGILYSYSYFQDIINWNCKLINEKDTFSARYCYFSYTNENLYVSILTNRIIKIDRETGKVVWLTNLGINNGDIILLTPSYLYATFYLNEMDGKVIFIYSPGYTLSFWIFNADNGEITNMFEVGRGEVCGVTYYLFCPSTFYYSEDLKTMYALSLEKIYKIDFSNDSDSMNYEVILSLPTDLNIYLTSFGLGSYSYITVNENILSLLILKGGNIGNHKIYLINIDIKNKKLLSQETFNKIPKASTPPFFGIKGIEIYKDSFIIIESSGVYRLNNETGLEELFSFDNNTIHTYEQVNPYLRYFDTLYTFHCGKITSLNLKTMKINWEISAGTENIAEQGIYYSDGILYCKANDDSAILAIDVLTGEQLWKTQLRREIFNNILITDQYIIAGNVDQCLPFGPHVNNDLESSIWLIDKKSGRIYWEINSKELKKECCNDTESVYDTERKGLLTPPILFDKNIYFFMDDKLYSIPLSSVKNLGSLKPIEFSARDNIYQFCPRLLLADNRKAYYMGESLIYSIENSYRLSSNRFELPVLGGGTITSICLDEEGLFVAAYLERSKSEAMRIYKLGRNFEEIWSVNLCKEIENCPITLMSLSLDDKNIYVNFKGFYKESNGRICIDKKSGEIKWKKDIEFLDYFKILQERGLYFPFREHFPFSLEQISTKNALLTINIDKLSFLEKESGREIYNLPLLNSSPTYGAPISFIPVDIFSKEDSSRIKGILFQSIDGNITFYTEENNK